MEFTKEEISLCKQVAEKYRKEVSKGDWWYRNEGNYPAEIVLVQGEGSASLFNDINDHTRLHSHGFPLWTLSDCLKFLREKFRILALRADDKIECELYFETHSCSEVGKTPLEACLKAVLAVLEEKK